MAVADIGTSNGVQVFFASTTSGTVVPANSALSFEMGIHPTNSRRSLGSAYIVAGQYCAASPRGHKPLKVVHAW
jgi:hypothetical protein